MEAYRYSIDFNAMVACHHYSVEHNENHKNGVNPGIVDINLVGGIN